MMHASFSKKIAVLALLIGAATVMLSWIETIPRKASRAERRGFFKQSGVQVFASRRSVGAIGATSMLRRMR